ncbi:MAG TPA: hypothetical protein VGN30_18555 [Steroidobacteraceae bacterium]|jgi:hypothetical protein
MRHGFLVVAAHLSTVMALGLGSSSIARAATVADYFFNGPIAYSSTSQTLSVATGSGGAVLFNSTGLPAAYSVTAANEAGSKVVMSMNLVGSSIVDDGFATTANFSTPTGYKVQLFLGNGSGGTAAAPVLTGWLSSMQASGIDGSNTGVLTGYLHPTGGLAFSYFSDPSDIIALDFNLSTDFSSLMYQTSFSGQINGQVQAQAAPVPIPATLPLLLSGLGLLGAVKAKRRVTLALR